MREYDAASNVVWEHFGPYQHHDIQRLPGGGAAYLAYTDARERSADSVVGGVPGSESPIGIGGEVIRELSQLGASV